MPRHTKTQTLFATTLTHLHRYLQRIRTPPTTLQIKLYQRNRISTTPTCHEEYGRNHRPQPRPQHQLGTPPPAPPQDPETDQRQLPAQPLPTVVHPNGATAHRHHKGQNYLGHPSGLTPYTTHAHPASPLPTETFNDNPNAQRADHDHLLHHQSEVPIHKHDAKLHLFPQLHPRHHQRSKHIYPVTASPTSVTNNATSTTSTNSYTTGASAGTSHQNTLLTRS
jgi:hypothetical protein